MCCFCLALFGFAVLFFFKPYFIFIPEILFQGPFLNSQQAPPVEPYDSAEVVDMLRYATDAL